MAKSAIMKSVPRLYNLGANFEHFEDQNLTYIFRNDLITNTSLKAELGNDKMEMTIELMEYVYENFDSIPVDYKYLNQLIEIAEKDSTMLIDYFSIDYNYDGKVFKPDNFVVRDKGILTKSVTFIANRNNTIALRAVDVFGNMVFKTFDIRGLK